MTEKAQPDQRKMRLIKKIQREEKRIIYSPEIDGGWRIESPEVGC